MQKVVNVYRRNAPFDEYGERDFAIAINQALKENSNRRIEAIYPILNDFGVERLLVILSDEK